MADARTVLAAVLGVALGAVLVVYPEAIVRVHTAGRLPHDREGEYGSSATPDRWRRLVQAAGVVVFAYGLYLGATAL